MILERRYHSEYLSWPHVLFCVEIADVRRIPCGNAARFYVAMREYFPYLIDFLTRPDNRRLYT